jgi:hypothetical protein
MVIELEPPQNEQNSLLGQIMNFLSNLKIGCKAI